MTGVGVVYRRELKAYFNTPIAAIFIAFLVLFLSFWLFLYKPFFAFERAEMRSLFAVMPWALLVFAPAITMRLWSDEFRVGTAEVLSTFPLHTRDIVLGKYLAALSVLGASLLCTAGIPLAIGLLGEPDWGPIIGGYAGCLFIGAFFVAIGCFASSLSQNQVIAMLVGVFLGIIFTLVLSPMFAAILAAKSPALARLVEQAGVISHFDSIERGVLALSDVAYFVAGSVLFLALNTFNVEWKKY